MLYYAGKYEDGEVHFQNTGKGLRVVLECGDVVISRIVTYLELQMSRNDNLIDLIVEEMVKEMDKYNQSV